MTADTLTRLQQTALATLMAAVTTVAGAQTPASQPASQPARRPRVVLTLANMPRLPVADYSLDQLAKMFPAYQRVRAAVTGPKVVMDPAALAKQLRKVNRAPETLRHLWPKCMQYAAQNPQDGVSLYTLGRAARSKGDFHADSSMAASLFIAAARSSDKDRLGVRIPGAMGTCMAELGRHDIAAGLFARYLQSQIERKDGNIVKGAMWTADPLMQIGRHDEALQIASLAMRDKPPESDPDENARLALYSTAAHCAAITGDVKLLNDIITAAGPLMTRAKTLKVFQGYQALLRGKPVNPAAAMATADEGDVQAYYHAAIFCMQVDLMRNQRKFYSHAHELLRFFPNDRIGWYLLDQYDRHRPDMDLENFYIGMAWLFPDDPWVKRIVADRRKRVPHPRDIGVPTPGKVLEQMGTLRWPQPQTGLKKFAWGKRYWLAPGKVAGAVATLVQQRKFDQARDLALRFHTMAVHVDGYHLRIRANQILHRIDESRATSQPADGRTEPKEQTP